jgi:hypothetical protein
MRVFEGMVFTPQLRSTRSVVPDDEPATLSCTYLGHRPIMSTVVYTDLAMHATDSVWATR